MSNTIVDMYISFSKELERQNNNPYKVKYSEDLICTPIIESDYKNNNIRLEFEGFDIILSIDGSWSIEEK